MKLPLPTNKLVTLALVGAVLAAGASIALALPGAFPGDGAPAASAPAAQGFSPASFFEHEDHEHEDEAYEHWLDESDER